MNSEHFDAVKTQLEADTALDVDDTVRLDSAGALVRDNYVILFGGGPDELDSQRMTKSQAIDDDAEFLYTVRSVGVTAAAARMVQSHACTQLIGFKPTITDRTCRKIRLDHSGQVEPDTSINPPLYYVDDEFVLNSSAS